MAEARRATPITPRCDTPGALSAIDRNLLQGIGTYRPVTTSSIGQGMGIPRNTSCARPTAPRFSAVRATSSDTSKKLEAQLRGKSIRHVASSTIRSLFAFLSLAPAPQSTSRTVRIHQPQNLAASAQDEADRSYWLNLIKVDGSILKIAPEALRADREVVLAAIQKDPLALQYACEDLRDDKEVVLKAAKAYGYALRYASAKLCNDKEVVMAAVQQAGSALHDASDKLRADKEVVMAAVQVNGFAWEYASKALRADKEVYVAAYRNNERMWPFVRDGLSSGD